VLGSPRIQLQVASAIALQYRDDMIRMSASMAHLISDISEYPRTVNPQVGLVGWVERSATHQLPAMGYGAHGRLHPSYALSLSDSC